MTSLNAHNLHARLGDLTVLRGIDAQFRAGDVTALIGPNGAGKSTLLRCLSGLLTPTVGQVQIDGMAIDQLTAQERARRIGYLPQDGVVNWDVTARSLVSLSRIAHAGLSSPEENDAAVEAAMATTDTLHLADRIATRLSGGERARVLLARVIAGKPAWLLADEPMANLDPAHQLKSAVALKSAAQKGVGVIIVTHDLNCASRIADRIVLMNDGLVAAQGDTADVLLSDMLRRTFDVDFAIVPDDEGKLLILPR